MTVDLSSYQVSNGETSSSTKQDNLIAAVQASLNAIGDLTKMAWAAGKILAPSQLTQEGATTGQALVWNGTSWAAGAAGGLYRKTTEKDVVNTTAETDLLNGEITVGAGVLSTDRLLRATLSGDMLNATGGTVTMTIRVKLGGTTLWDSGGSGNFASGAARRAWRLTFDIANLGSASSQFLNGIVILSDPAAPTTGLGTMGSTTTVYQFATNGTAAVNTALAAALVVTVQLSTASANFSFRLKNALVEVV